MVVRVWRSVLLLTLTLLLGSCTGAQRTTTPSTSPSSKQASTQGEDKPKRECTAKFVEGNPKLTCANIKPDEDDQAKSIRLNEKPLPKEKVMLPDETLKTFKSEPDLQFNESSIAKAGHDTTFKFDPGLRRSRLEIGKTLIMILPGSLSVPKVQSSSKAHSNEEKFALVTNEANSESLGTAYVVKRDDKQRRTQVFSLTESPVRVSAKGKTVELKAGQSITATEQGLGNVEKFNLCEFLATEELVAGLGPTKKDEEIVRKKSPSVQLTYYAVRGEVMLAYQKLCPRVVTETVVQQVCPREP